MSVESQKSPEAENLRKIGKISGLHGLKGELYIHVFSKEVSWIDQLKKIVFEDAKGVQKLFDVQSVRPFKDGFLVFVDGLTSRTEAEVVRGNLVWVSSDIFTTDDEDDSFYLAEIEGFGVFDQTQFLGQIQGFSSNTVQDLILVEMDFGIVEIPLVEEFLETIDFNKKEIYMKLPEGLIEIQRESQK